MNLEPVAVSSHPVAAPDPIRPTLQQARADIMDAAHAPKTIRNYRIYWRLFTAWCTAEKRIALPTDADTIIDFLLVRLDTGVKLSTLTACLSSIRDRHLQAGLRNPVDVEVQGFMRNARRKLKQRPIGKNALTSNALRDVVQALDREGSGLARRDKAMILMGFASGWRGGEICGLGLNEISFIDNRLCLQLGASKTDQEAREGRRVYIPEGQCAATCPVRALQSWLEFRGEWQGPLFLQRRSLGQSQAASDQNRCAPVPPQETLAEPGRECRAFRLALAARGHDYRFGRKRGGCALDCAADGASESRHRVALRPAGDGLTLRSAGRRSLSR